MKKVKEHFEAEAEKFDRIILKLIPYYKEMITALIEALPYKDTRRVEVLDLGCGTGTISKNIKERYNKATVTCVDLAENMIEMAKIKLSSYKDIEYSVSDFGTYDFDKEYNIIISSLALHHIKDNAGKREFYNRIYNNLKPGGVFYNADVVLGAGKYLQEVYIKKWKEFMKQHLPQEEIENRWMQQYRDEDRPAVLTDQIKWLDNTGFKQVDIIWKYYNFAVYGGKKLTDNSRESRYKTAK